MDYILITGTSTGIGFDCAQFLINKGYFVFGSVRKESDAQRLEKELGSNFKALLFDVCDAEAIQQSVEIVQNICGQKGLKALINNAGIAVFGPWQFVEIEQVEHQMNVNFYGVVRVCQAFLPLLGGEKNTPLSPGKIINISSISGLFSNPFLGPYCASKFALESFSDSLRRELLVYGIDVILLEPGPVKTPIWEKARSHKLAYPSTAYEPVLKHFDQLIGDSEKQAIEVRKVSQTIYKTIIRSNPRTRYILAKNKFFLKMIPFIPDRWIDYFIKRAYRKAGIKV